MKTEQIKKEQINDGIKKEQINDELKEIHKKVTEKPDQTLFMACVPIETKKGFVKWTDKNFGSGKINSGHYGFALKHLWDFYNGSMESIGKMLESEIENMKFQIVMLNDEIEKLKGGNLKGGKNGK